ncbi:MAG: glycoside hydrolase family 53 protein [Verrucomicrobiia bacterium]|jgi:arabinogalactan endo-1,4-beta-galactosidase
MKKKNPITELSQRKKALLLATLITLFSILIESAKSEDNIDFLLGGDVSFILQMENAGFTYKVNGKPQDPFLILKNHGLNAIRLRLWHTPTNGFCNAEATLKMAKRLATHGFKLILNFHYSDTWADPAHQKKPAAWEHLSFPELKQEIFTYTSNFVAALVSQNTPPYIVQTGNEITPGFLWDDGNVGKFNDELHWRQFTELLKSAINGVRSVKCPTKIYTMLHIDCGGNNARSRWFFDNIENYKVDYDVIGVSYYYWWHGTIDNLKTNISDLAQRYKKPVIVVETAHPWRLYNFQYPRGKNRIQPHPGYEATPQGQKKFLTDLVDIVRNLPDTRGKGVIYWAPEWVPTKGIRSNWGEVTLFDDNGEPLPALEALDIKNYK